MLLTIFLSLLFITISVGENVKVKPYVVFPVPFEMPNRNDRSTQCWLRIEDIEVVDTIAIYCHIALKFLKDHIKDYNRKKSLEDGVDLDPFEVAVAAVDESQTVSYKYITVKDWKSTTVMDPATSTRLYVTDKADCKMIMYTREGMCNYKVECEKILLFLNNNNNAVTGTLSPAVLIGTVYLLFFG